MSSPIRFFVAGLAAPGGSKRAYVTPKGQTVIVDACKRSKPWRARVGYVASQHIREPLAGPIALTLTFFLPRPKGHYGTGKNADTVKKSAPRFPIGTPDTTKLTRSTEDALKSIAWKDDAQIVAQRCFKTYGNLAGVAIEIRPIDPSEEP